MQSKYSDYQLRLELMEALADLRFVEPTPIQHEVLPLLLKGRNLIAQAPTGTGKTHAFLLPLFEQLNIHKQNIQAIILAPTRELAEQIFKRAVELADYFPDAIDIQLLIGGTDRTRGIERLKNSQPQIVIGTPGRVFDLVKEGALDATHVAMVVLDEADMIFDTGFISEVDGIIGRVPETAQLAIFSATIPQVIEQFAQKYMAGAAQVAIDAKQKTPVAIEHLAIPVRRKSREDLIVDITEMCHPYLALIFANTRKNADALAGELRERGIRIGVLHGDLSARERRQMIRRIRDLEFQYVVATDIAARGIDIEGISHIINYELPDDLAFYIHRVGRTARGSNEGMAISLITPEQEVAVNQLRERGIDINYVEIKNAEFVPVASRNKRTRVNRIDDESLKASHQAHARKAKKVKPGYKKKLEREVKAAVGKAKRQQQKRNNKKR